MYCSISTQVKRGRNGVDGLLTSDEPGYCYVNGFYSGWFSTDLQVFNKLSAPAPQPSAAHNRDHIRSHDVESVTGCLACISESLHRRSNQASKITEPGMTRLPSCLLVTKVID